MKFKFFAYGSFANNQIHHGKIKNFVQSAEQAFVKAVVYRLRCGFPTLIPDSKGDLVSGVLYELNVPESFLAILDQLMNFDPLYPEKNLFQRKTLQLQVGNFSLVEAEAYCLNPKKKTNFHKKITGGDWLRDLNEKPPITENLQVRQKDYIRKLAESKGRDIVPIKLDLYRELMNLELIVDKGRRLALTPLGKEAAYFVMQ